MVNKRKRCESQTGVVDRLIKLKVKCNFSVKQLQKIIRLYEPNECKSIEKSLKKELRQNYSAFRLHGCAKCDNFIWISNENRPCDICGNQDGRFVLFSRPFFDASSLQNVHLLTDMIPLGIQRRKSSTSRCCPALL